MDPILLDLPMPIETPRLILRQEAGYPEPKWEELGTVLRVTFFPHSEVVKQAQLGAKTGTGIMFDEDTIKLIKFCEKPRYFSEILTYMVS